MCVLLLLRGAPLLHPKTVPKHLQRLKDIEESRLVSGRSHRPRHLAHNKSFNPRDGHKNSQSSGGNVLNPFGKAWMEVANALQYTYKVNSYSLELFTFCIGHQRSQLNYTPGI